uniref:Uncharacterized protein n=1 Tax=Mycena chlorophos TaxID=658473 RepID=A0ABQ0LND6_MYCCL|nr:predicted protein [Mycena chlorophos]
MKVAPPGPPTALDDESLLRYLFMNVACRGELLVTDANLSSSPNWPEWNSSQRSVKNATVGLPSFSTGAQRSSGSTFNVPENRNFLMRRVLICEPANCKASNWLPPPPVTQPVASLPARDGIGVRGLAQKLEIGDIDRTSKLKQPDRGNPTPQELGEQLPTAEIFRRI